MLTKNRNIYIHEIFIFIIFIYILIGCHEEENHFDRGMECLNAKKYDDAIDHFTKYIEEHPEDEYGYYNRGQIYYKKRIFDKAIVDMKKTLEINSDNAEAYKIFKHSMLNLFKMKAHKPKTEKVVPIEGELTDYKSYMRTGKAFYKDELYEEAIEEFTNAIELQPDNVAAYIERGKANMRATEYMAAQSDFNKAIELQPDNFEAYKKRRNFYTRLAFYSYVAAGKMKEYFDPLEETFIKIKEIYRDKIDPLPVDDYQPYYKLAIRDCNTMLELKPDDKSTIVGRGTAYFYLEEYEKSLEDFNRVLASYPHDEASLYFKIKSCEKLGLKEEEIKMWKEIIEIGGEKGDTNFELIRARLDGRSPVVYAKERIKALEGK